MTRRPFLTLGLVTLTALASAGIGIGRHLEQNPDPVAFIAVKGRIPDATVRSERVRLTGFHGRLPARVEGRGAVLLIGGERAGVGASVKAGDEVALQLEAGPFGTVRDATLVIRDLTATFVVESLRRPPTSTLAFDTVTTDAGRMAFSSFAAPAGFALGTRLTSSSPALRVVTKRGKSTTPLDLAPGDVIQLAHPAPPQPGASLTIDLRLGEHAARWTIAAR